MLHRFLMLNHILFKFIIVGVINTLIGGVLIFFIIQRNRIGILAVLCGIRYWSVFMVVAFTLTIAFSYLMAYDISKPAINYLLRDSPQKNPRECRVTYWDVFVHRDKLFGTEICCIWK